MTAVLTVSKITKAYSLGKENTLDDIPGYMNAGENDEAWYSNLEILHVFFFNLRTVSSFSDNFMQKIYSCNDNTEFP